MPRRTVQDGSVMTREPNTVQFVQGSELGSIEIGTPKTSSGTGHATVADVNFSPLVPFTGTTVGGITVNTLQDNDYDYTAPIGGIELSGWT